MCFNITLKAIYFKIKLFVKVRKSDFWGDPESINYIYGSFIYILTLKQIYIFLSKNKTYRVILICILRFFKIFFNKNGKTSNCCNNRSLGFTVNSFSHSFYTRLMINRKKVHVIVFRVPQLTPRRSQI